jgi:hypothetical protein
MQIGNPRPDIACPVRSFSPPEGFQWWCYPDGCGGSFDTFATRGRCPHCEAQFSWTMCPACEKVSAHRAWYHGAG